MRHFGYFLPLTVCAVLLTTASGASDVKTNGFSVAFPCQAKSTSQTVPAGNIKIPVLNHSCEKDGSVYYVVTSSYPQGFIAKKTIKAAFADAVGGAAANAKGIVRSDTPISLSGTAGRDVLIDVKSQKAAVHLRVFFMGDKQYQVMVVTLPGQENSQTAIGFLNAFKLTK